MYRLMAASASGYGHDHRWEVARGADRGALEADAKARRQADDAAHKYTVVYWVEAL